MKQTFTIQDITHEVINELLFCDENTGVCIWKHRPEKYFKSKSAAKSWNTRYAGREAFTSKSGNGYFHGSIFKVTLQKHRVIWFYFYGKWPEKEIDHRDKNKGNNSLSNLFEVTGSQNSKNMGFTTRNTSGVVGASYRKDMDKFEVSIFVNGEKKTLGYTKDLTEALNWRKSAQKQHGFNFNSEA